METILPFGRLWASPIVTAGGGGSFTPADLPSLLAWYTAGVGTYSDAGVTPATNTQTVMQWNDRSGHGYHLRQATSGNRPQYLSAGFNTRATVQFAAAGSKYMLTTADTVHSGSAIPTSCFAVGQMLTGTSANARMVAYCQPFGTDFDGLGGVIYISRDASNNAWLTYRGAALPSQAISLATNYRLGVVYDGSLGTSYTNNVGAGATANTNPYDEAGKGPGVIGVGVNIVNNQIAGTAFWDGPVSEVVITTAAMSAGDRTNLDNYFKTTWGL